MIDCAWVHTSPGNKEPVTYYIKYVLL